MEAERATTTGNVVSGLTCYEVGRSVVVSWLPVTLALSVPELMLCQVQDSCLYPHYSAMYGRSALHTALDCTTARTSPTLPYAIAATSTLQELKRISSLPRRSHKSAHYGRRSLTIPCSHGSARGQGQGLEVGWSRALYLNRPTSFNLHPKSFLNAFVGTTVSTRRRHSAPHAMPDVLSLVRIIP